MRLWVGSLQPYLFPQEWLRDAAREFKDKIEPLLQDYCYDCHGDGAKKGDISLDEFKDLSSHLSNHDLWLRVWRNARTHLMPPVDEDFQPSPEERRFLTSWIEGNVLKLDPENPDPGRVTIRRLNREEYRNTIFDLVGVSYNVDDNFPPDDTGFGFDTIGEFGPPLPRELPDGGGEHRRTGSSHHGGAEASDHDRPGQLPRAGK